MSLSETQMMDVMSLADGELDGEDLARTKKLVEDDAEAKELFASLRAIGDGVRSSFDVPKIDVRDAVMRSVTPNDLDKARIKRTARTRMAVVGVSLVAIAAAVMFYVRDQQLQQQAQNASKDAGTQAVLASSSPAGVEVDFVDTPTPVSLFYVPAEKTTSGAEGKTTETPASVIVWVDDDGELFPVKTRRAFGRAILASVASLAMSAFAHAQQPMTLQQGAPPPQQATLDILVLHATNQPGAGSIAPSIANMPQLKRPPFSAYNTYTQLARQSMTLVKGTPATYTLINGRIVQITLTNVLPGPRYEISAAINQPGGGPYINLLRVTSPPNDTFFVAGQQYQGGVLVIGFTLH